MIDYLIDDPAMELLSDNEADELVQSEIDAIDTAVSEDAEDDYVLASLSDDELEEMEDDGDDYEEPEDGDVINIDPDNYFDYETEEDDEEEESDSVEYNF